MGVKLVSASAGSVEIVAPTTASNYTATMPAATGTVILDSATQSFTNKSFDSASVATVSGTAPLYMARAWVNFNGTGTVAIRGSGNVSSITDNGTGDYTVNFTTAMSDANYAASCMTQPPTGVTSAGFEIKDAVSPTASALRLTTFRTTTGTVNDPPFINVSVFR